MSWVGWLIIVAALVSWLAYSAAPPGSCRNWWMSTSPAPASIAG